MIRSDFHVHTRYCDGRNSPEEIIQTAISMGIKHLGFSGHSYTPFDREPCMSPEGTEEYKREIRRLKGKYESQIEVLCGIEQDYYCDMPTDDYDYVIGSVHYVRLNGEYRHVDSSPESFFRTVNEWFGGDAYSFVESYYELVSDVVNRTGADIIGHFDLITKFNEGSRFFDEENVRYVNASNTALDRLINANRPFEINTGAISRGYKKEPYPSKRLLKRIAEHGGSVILSSDSHQANTLCFKFDECKELVNSLGLLCRGRPRCS